MNHREAFIKRLTVDSTTKDARRKEFNQAVFDPQEGWAVWAKTDFDMILTSYDSASKDVETQ